MDFNNDLRTLFKSFYVMEVSLCSSIACHYIAIISHLMCISLHNEANTHYVIDTLLIFIKGNFILWQHQEVTQVQQSCVKSVGKTKITFETKSR